MASTLTLAIESLKISLGRQNPFETLRIVDNIVQTFENDDTSSSGVSNHTAPEIDLSISKLFDAQQGMLTFLTRSIKCDKIHREANCKVLALFERILSGAHRQKCAEYAAAIVDVMLQFIRAGNVSAGEKERATVVLRTLVEQTLCARVPLNEVLSQVLLVSHNKNATGRCTYYARSLPHINMPITFINANAQFCSTFTNCSECWPTDIRSVCKTVRTTPFGICS